MLSMELRQTSATAVIMTGFIRLPPTAGKMKKIATFLSSGEFGFSHADSKAAGREQDRVSKVVS